ncbi:unnamed protein product, partial [Meganyctiphanes norvegica]
KGGSLRLIIDLSRLNKFLVVHTFRMESVWTIAPGLIGALWGYTVDLEDAYFNVPIAEVFQAYFAFVVDGVTYIFLRLPFGLSVAPWAFHRVMRPIKGFCHRQGLRLHSYLDDFFLIQRTRQLLLEDSNYLLEVFRCLGVAVNHRKSHLSPSRSLEYLGVVFQPRGWLPLSPSGQGHVDLSTVQGRLGKVPHVPPSSGAAGWHPQLCLQFCATGRSSSSPLGFLDERLYFSLLQGCAGSLGYGFQGSPSRLDGRGPAGGFRPDVPPYSVSSSHDGLVPLWMEWCPPSPLSVRSLAPFLRRHVHQLAGVDGRQELPAGVCASSSGSVRPFDVGQHHLSSLLTPSRGLIVRRN